MEASIQQLRDMMWKHAGLLRDHALLATASFASIEQSLNAIPSPSWGRRTYEARSLYLVAHAIVRSALAREESRGAHFRSDYPQHDDLRYRGKHSILGPAGLRFAPLIAEQVLIN